MRQKSGPPKETSERVVRNIRRATRKRYSAEEKIRIVLDGGADSPNLTDSVEKVIGRGWLNIGRLANSPIALWVGRLSAVWLVTFAVPG